LFSEAIYTKQSLLRFLKKKIIEITEISSAQPVLFLNLKLIDGIASMVM
jgi:hypothetical protein